MKSSFFKCLSLVILCSACKTVSVQNKQYHTTTQKVSLGSIGIAENYALEQTYNHSGIPNYTKPVKVQITPIPFNTSTFKAYEEAKGFQPTNLSISYVDSLKVKPKFLNIETSDNIGLIQMLNANTNKDIKTYLLNQKQSHIVTNISMALNESDFNEISKAEEVFIEANGIKSVALKLYREGKVTRIMNFNEGVIFAYRTASPCWKENNKYQLEIVDLVGGDNDCPSKTYKSSSKAKKKINYYKF